MVCLIQTYGCEKSKMAAAEAEKIGLKLTERLVMISYLAADTCIGLHKYSQVRFVVRVTVLSVESCRLVFIEARSTR